MATRAKILQIGNYPPPMCGWAIQTSLVTDELRRRGFVCEVLKINENRKVKDPAYIDVQDGFDYLRKVFRYAWRGYRLNVHMNGMGRTGYLLALVAVITGRMVGRPALITFHGGLPQNNFPRYDHSLWHWAFFTLFRLAGNIACDSAPIKKAIEAYGIPPAKVRAIATFSSQYANFKPAALPEAAEMFSKKYQRVIFCYVAFRPEYRLETLRAGMKLFREFDPGSGFVWLGFPEKELIMAQDFIKSWPPEERETLLLLGNLTHDQFLTLVSRSFIFLRTPACDGVCASVLEAIALGIPVVASENGRRPDGVVTYEDTDAADMCAQMTFVSQHYEEIKAGLKSAAGEDNIGVMAEWLSHAGEDIPASSAVPSLP